MRTATRGYISYFLVTVIITLSSPSWARSQTTTPFHLTVVSGTNTEYLSPTGWQPATAAWVHSYWPSIGSATWIWRSYLVTPEEAHLGTKAVTFRARFSIPANAINVQGSLRITADNAYEVFMNGVKIGGDGQFSPGSVDESFRSVETYQFTPLFGSNEIIINVINYASNVTDPYKNSAGVIFQADMDQGIYPSPQPHHRPLIFIPGIMGSSLIEQGSGNNLWLGGLRSSHNELSLAPNYNGPTIIADDAMRSMVFDTAGVMRVDVYAPLLSSLTSATGGYVEYQIGAHYERRTTAECDISQAANMPTLFVFAYDWRLDVAENASKLADYVGCVHKLWPDSDIDIVAHSMGGLVARRYVLQREQSGQDSYVNNLITIATPWLGAPRAYYVMAKGNYDWKINAFVPSLSLRTLATYFPGVHELLPSRGYVALGGQPLKEDGWDINHNGIVNDGFKPFNLSSVSVAYNQILDVFEQQLDPQHPSSNLRSHITNFHTDAQDNGSLWPIGIHYYHFYGLQQKKQTIETVVFARRYSCPPSLGGPKYCWANNRLEPVSLKGGDGTVPRLSAERIGTGSMNTDGATLIPCWGPTDEKTEHTGMASNPLVIADVLNILSGQPLNAGQCYPKTATAAVNQLAQSEPPVQLARYLTIYGSPVITATDSLGNQTTPEAAPLPALAVIPEVGYYGLGNDGHLLIFPITGTYTITLQGGAIPLELDIETGTGASSTAAVRYNDLNLPVGHLGKLVLATDGSVTLHMDTDGNGSLEMLVIPTAQVSGAAANDRSGPEMTVTAAGPLESQTVTITATDATGVGNVYYSLDGTTFQLYTAPFTVNGMTQLQVYAFADDTVGNRSAAITATLVRQSFMPLVRR